MALVEWESPSIFTLSYMKCQNSITMLAVRDFIDVETTTNIPEKLREEEVTVAFRTDTHARSTLTILRISDLSIVLPVVWKLSPASGLQHMALSEPRNFDSSVNQRGCEEVKSCVS